jgi:hypothetical protein
MRIDAMRKLVAAWLLCLLIPASLEAQGNSLQTRDVEVRIYLIDIEGIDTVAQNFTANLTLVFRWKDPSLAHAGPNSISKPLDEIWSPRIQILNQQRLVSTLPRLAEVYPDGEVVQRQRFWGGFSQPLDLQAFPFDSQRLQVSLANVGFGEELVNLIPSPSSGISKSLTMPDWDVTGWEFVAKNIKSADGSFDLKGMVLSVDVKRDSSFFKYKVIMPLILIVMMSWLVFWIDPVLVASQISVSITAMLTMIAYRFALAGMMPRLAFLTSLDHFVIASTLVVFLSMTEVVYTAHLSTSDQLDKARRVDRNARWIAPVVYFAMAAEILYFRIWF